jgi:replicative DNA helicase
MTLHHLEAERVLIGVLFKNNALIPSCTLSPAMFDNPPYRRIYAACQLIYPDPVNFVTVTDKLIAEGQLDSVGGPETISGITDGIPRMSGIGAYERIIKDAAVRRAMVKIADRLTKGAASPEADNDKTLADAGALLSRLTAASASATVTTKNLWAMEAEDLVRRVERAETFAKFGIGRLDRYTRPGMQAGSVWVLGARTSVGKSAFLCQTALYNLLRGRRVLLIACEMGYIRTSWRLYSGLSKVSFDRIREPKTMSEREKLAYMQAMDAIAGKDNFLMAYNPRPTVQQITGYVRAAKAALDGLDLVVIDYFQKVRPARQRGGMYEERTEVASDLVAMAGAEGVPVLLGSQLNRNAETDEERDRPQKSELKGTGSLEEEATAVILLHRWATNGGGAEIIIAKHQDGECGRLAAEFDGATATWICEDEDYQAHEGGTT